MIIKNQCVRRWLRYPELKAKGYDCAVITSWLARQLEASPCHNPDLATVSWIKCFFSLWHVFVFPVSLGELFLFCHQAIWAIDRVLRLLQGAGMFLQEQEQLEKEVLGELFIKTYVKLAGDALRNGDRLFRVRPKLHMMHHLVIQRRSSMPNPAHWSTWVDEDMIKKIMRIKKGTHKRNACEHSLKRYLMGLPAKLQATLQQMKK